MSGEDNLKGEGEGELAAPARAGSQAGLLRASQQRAGNLIPAASLCLLSGRKISAQPRRKTEAEGVLSVAPNPDRC